LNIRGASLAIALFALSFVVAPIAAANGPDSLSNPAQEARARELQKEFRCLVCQGQSLDDSNAPLAADLRRLIRQRILAGDSDDEIGRYLVARYGEFILMKPPFEPQTYALWLGPILVLILAGGVGIWVVSRAQRRARPS
jgi:cytochrome c-type biogenesis protein CcmH